LERGSAICWWDMQTGKTRAALHAFDQLWQRGGAQTLIVVCPAYARATWLNEMEEMGLGLPVSQLFGIKARRVVGQPLRDPRGVPAVPSVVLCSWDVVGAWLGELVGQARLSALVLDESHEHAVNPATIRYKAVSRLAAICDRTWLLTGTIYRKTAMDIYWQAKLVGGFRDLKANTYGERYCVQRFNPYIGGFGAYEYRGLKPGVEGQLVRLIPNLSRVHEEDCHDVPEIRRVATFVDVGSGYTGGDNEENLEAARSRLIPIKVHRTLEYLRDLPERPVVVYGWHREYVKGVADGIPGAACVTGETPAMERAEIQRQFQAGRIPVLVANLKAFGLSVSLVRAKHMIFGEPHWSETDHRQAEGRIHGAAQHAERLHYTYLLVKNSVDEYVWRVKLNKGKMMDRLDQGVDRIQVGA
jgi:hypothetical protein